MIVGLLAAVTSTTDVAASWTDRVLGQSRFTTTPFGFQSSVDGGSTWATHSEASPAVLALNAGSTALLPGRSVVGAISLRSVLGSPVVSVTVDGTSTTSAGLGSVLRYKVIRSATCVAGSFGAGASFVVGSATTDESLSADSAVGAVTLPAGTTTAVGTPVPLCFLVTLPDTLAIWTNSSYRSQSFGATWTFFGTG